jgi:hypothetical protein
VGLVQGRFGGRLPQIEALHVGLDKGFFGARLDRLALGFQEFESQISNVIRLSFDID